MTGVNESGLLGTVSLTLDPMETPDLPNLESLEGTFTLVLNTAEVIRDRAQRSQQRSAGSVMCRDAFGRRTALRSGEPRSLRAFSAFLCVLCLRER